MAGQGNGHQKVTKGTILPKIPTMSQVCHQPENSILGLQRLVHALPSIVKESEYSFLSRRLADRNAELERVNRMNQSLQEDWERSAAMKRQRDLEEKAFER